LEVSRRHVRRQNSPVEDPENRNTDNLEDAIDEEGRNLTQQRIDAEGAEDRPVDADWPEGVPADRS
jgi:hypothetical protein